jgi:hypothetical protein
VHRRARLFQVRVPASARDVQIDPEATALRWIFVLAIAVHERWEAFGYRVQKWRFGVGVVRPATDMQADVLDLQLGQRTHRLFGIERDLRQAG